MAPSAAQNTVEEPFPISRVADRYLLFNIDVISHCRRNHNICGMLVGTIPNLSQQNVFLGIPVELMPEEARVLVEKGAAYIVDDAEEHKKTFKDMSREDRLKWLEEMDRRGNEALKS
jgi:tRNA-splicing endonuclease subunit Sen34